MSVRAARLTPGAKRACVSCVACVRKSSKWRISAVPKMNVDADALRDYTDSLFALIDYLNNELFEGQLPKCLIGFTRRDARSESSFTVEQVNCDKPPVLKLNLNPNLFRNF